MWKVQLAGQIYPLTPHPPNGSNWGHKMADWILLPYISCIIAFTASEWISYKESLDSRSDLPTDLKTKLSLNFYLR